MFETVLPKYLPKHLEKLRVTGILKSFERKYRKVSFNRVHIVKSLCYFKDAEVEPMPKMLVPFNWHESKKFFQDEAKKIAKSWLQKPISIT